MKTNRYQRMMMLMSTANEMMEDESEAVQICARMARDVAQSELDKMTRKGEADVT